MAILTRKLVLLATLPALLAGCSSYQPYDYKDQSEIPNTPGFLGDLEVSTDSFKGKNSPEHSPDDTQKNYSRKSFDLWLEKFNTASEQEKYEMWIELQLDRS